jgi:WS/DGAT/MGAT family acyltransferase
MAGFLARRQRMASVDTAWLRMDAPGNLMMIVGVVVCDGAPDVTRLRLLLQDRLLVYRQFRSRAVLDPTGAWWEEDLDIDLGYHLVRIGLAGARDKSELQRLVAQLAGQALDPTKPLWQFHLVDDYDGGHALIVRIHHCIADGIALVGVLMSMTVSHAETPTPREAASAGGPARDASADPGEAANEVPPQWSELLRPFTAATVKAIGATGDLAARALHRINTGLQDPDAAAQAAGGLLRTLSQGARDLAALALMEDDTATPLKGRPGGAKAVAWTEPLALADVKAVGRALGCSVNDVLMSCVAGALRGYLLEHDVELAGAELRAMVPVNLRGSGVPRTLGNRFGLVPLLLPVGIADPIARVIEVRARMNALKGSYTAVLAMSILGLVGMVPRSVQKQALDLLARKATAVMTNVPGPQQPQSMAGARMRQMMFWVPQSGDIGVGVSVLSYSGGVQFGLVTDRRLCDDPQSIIDRFAPQFESLVHAVLMQPWDDDADPALAARSLDATEDLAVAADHLAHRGDHHEELAGGGTPSAPAGAAAGHEAARGRAGPDHGPQGAASATAPAGGNGTARPAGTGPRRRRSAFAAARDAG